jgi:hypothetical protein
MKSNQFDPRPDPELGHLLREHLGGADPAAFGSRLRAALAAAPPASSWDVLSGWAARGLVAAALVLLTLGVLLGRQIESAGAIEQALEVTSAPAELVAAAYSPSPDVVLGAAMEDR